MGLSEATKVSDRDTIRYTVCSTVFLGSCVTRWPAKGPGLSLKLVAQKWGLLSVSKKYTMSRGL